MCHLTFFGDASSFSRQNYSKHGKTISTSKPYNLATIHRTGHAVSTHSKQEARQMFNVIIAFKNSERNWQFLFKEEKNANQLIREYEALAKGEGAMSIVDDFGVSALIPFADI